MLTPASRPLVRASWHCAARCAMPSSLKRAGLNCDLVLSSVARQPGSHRAHVRFTAIGSLVPRPCTSHTSAHPSSDDDASAQWKTKKEENEIQDHDTILYKNQGYVTLRRVTVMPAASQPRQITALRHMDAAKNMSEWNRDQLIAFLF